MSSAARSPRSAPSASEPFLEFILDRCFALLLGTVGDFLDVRTKVGRLLSFLFHLGEPAANVGSKRGRTRGRLLPRRPLRGSGECTEGPNHDEHYGVGNRPPDETAQELCTQAKIARTNPADHRARFALPRAAGGCPGFSCAGIHGPVRPLRGHRLSARRVPPPPLLLARTPTRKSAMCRHRPQIGRASCREGVEAAEVAASVG